MRRDKTPAQPGSHFDLLKACSSGATPQNYDSKLLASLPPVFDWNTLLDSADWHGTFPLVARNLIFNYSDFLPAAVLDRIHHQLRTISQRNLWLTGELIAVIDLLSRRGIRALPYKGPALSIVAYGDIGLRQIRDLDLLLAESDIYAAKEALAAAGYQHWQEIPLDAARERAWMHTSYEYPMEKPGVSVELHWHVLPPAACFRLDFSELWERATQTQVANVLVPVMSSEDQLLLGCVHGMKHAWDRLSLVCDVAYLVRACPDIHWDEFIRRARTAHAERITRLGLRLAADLLDAPVPRAVLDCVNASVLNLEGAIRQRMSKQWVADEHPRAGWWLFLRSREHLWDRLRWAIAYPLTPTPADWNALRLPDSLFWLYRLLRPLRLLRNFLSTVLKSVSMRFGSAAKRSHGGVRV